MKVTLLVPTLNEIDGMRDVMPKVKREWVDQILVVDGQSTDGTAECACKMGYEVIVQKKWVCATHTWKHSRISKAM